VAEAEALLRTVFSFWSVSAQNRFVYAMLMCALTCVCCVLVVPELSTTMEVLGEDRQRPVQKAKMEIVLKKSADFHDIVAAEASNGRTSSS